MGAGSILLYLLGVISGVAVALAVFATAARLPTVAGARPTEWRLMAGLCAAVAALVLIVPGNKAHAQPGPPQAAAPYRALLVRSAHTAWGLDAPVAMLAAQVHAESAWRPEAVSRAGAQGLAQFMPATAAWWCASEGIPAAACLPHNPAWALRAQAGYMRWLLDRTPEGYTAHDRAWVALRAYNGGLGHWQAEARATGAREPTRTAVDAACGHARRHRSHCPENLGYPRKILQLQARYLGWGPGVEPPGGNAPTPTPALRLRMSPTLLRAGEAA